MDSFGAPYLYATKQFAKGDSSDYGGQKPVKVYVLVEQAE